MTIRTLLLSVASVLLLGTTVGAQPPAQGIWIGVLTYDDGGKGDGSIPAGAAAGLRLVGALTDGAWRFDDGDALTPPFPEEWTGWLVDGRRERFSISGPPHRSGVFDTPTLSANVPLPRPTPDSHTDTVMGVAAVGDVNVFPFSEVADIPGERVADAHRQARLAAELAELRAVVVRYDATDIPDAATLPLSRLAAAPFEVDMRRVAALPNGTRVSVIEGFTTLGVKGNCTQMRSGSAVVQEASGDTRAVGSWSYLICDELFIRHSPLAILERGGEMCWLEEFGYEDGLRYVMTPPGVINDQGNESSQCAIR